MHFSIPLTKRGLKQSYYIEEELKHSKRMNMRKAGCIMALNWWWADLFGYETGNCGQILEYGKGAVHDENLETVEKSKC